MAKITVTAGEGVRAQVLVRQQTTLSREFPELKNSDGQIIAVAKQETYVDTQTLNVVTFASEAREFDLQPNQHLMVLEQV
jgi:hypothetical protein